MPKRPVMVLILHVLAKTLSKDLIAVHYLCNRAETQLSGMVLLTLVRDVGEKSGRTRKRENSKTYKQKIDAVI